MDYIAEPEKGLSTVKKRTIVSVLALLILIGCQYSGKTLPETKDLTQAQMCALALRILENTPDHIHWAKGTVFSWVLLQPGKNPVPPGLNEEVMRLLKEKYTLYTKKEDIPAPPDHKSGDVCQLGFNFQFDVTIESPGIVKVNYSDYEGPLAGSIHWTRYKWNRGNWEIIEKSIMVVADQHVHSYVEKTEVVAWIVRSGSSAPKLCLGS